MLYLGIVLLVIGVLMAIIGVVLSLAVDEFHMMLFWLAFIPAGMGVFCLNPKPNVDDLQNGRDTSINEGPCSKSHIVKI